MNKLPKSGPERSKMEGAVETLKPGVKFPMWIPVILITSVGIAAIWWSKMKRT